MQIFIKTCGKTITLDVEAEHTIRDVKSRIDVDFDYIAFKPFISRLEDERTLSHYNIRCSGYELQLGFEVVIRRMNATSFTLDVLTSDTIEDVKTKIRAHEEQGAKRLTRKRSSMQLDLDAMSSFTKSGQQRLILEDEELESLRKYHYNNQTGLMKISDYNIQNKSVIDLVVTCGCGRGLTCAAHRLELN